MRYRHPVLPFALGLAVGAGTVLGTLALTRPTPAPESEPAEVSEAASAGGRQIDAALGRPTPEVTVAGRADAEGKLAGRAYNPGDRPVPKLRVTVRTDSWVRDFDAPGPFPPRATTRFVLDVGEPRVAVRAVSSSAVPD